MPSMPAGLLATDLVRSILGHFSFLIVEDLEIPMFHMKHFKSNFYFSSNRSVKFLGGRIETHFKKSLEVFNGR